MAWYTQFNLLEIFNWNIFIVMTFFILGIIGYTIFENRQP